MKFSHFSLIFSALLMSSFCAHAMDQNNPALPAQPEMPRRNRMVNVPDNTGELNLTNDTPQRNVPEGLVDLMNHHHQTPDGNAMLYKGGEFRVTGLKAFLCCICMYCTPEDRA